MEIKNFFEEIFKRKPKEEPKIIPKKKLGEVEVSIIDMLKLVLVYLAGVIVGLILAIFSNYIFLKDAGKKDILIAQIENSSNYQIILVCSLVFGIVGFGIGYLLKKK